MPRMNVTERKLAAMLKENTGASFLDSGGAYGRNWERNQKRDFRKEAAAKLEPVWEYTKDGNKFEPLVTFNTFHWLAERLEFDSAMNRRYQTFAKSRRANDGELAIMDEFTEHLRESGEVTGLYGEGDPFTVNTYNGESLLSQTLQYRLFGFGGKVYILLQIHGGCDVRGGYTDAKVFQMPDEEWLSVADGQIFAEGSNDYWQTDDGYHWYCEGSSQGRELQDYPVSRDPAHKGDKEHVFVDAAGIAYSPISGGRLVAA